MKRRWLITIILIPLVLCVTGWVSYRYHTVYEDECGDLYRRYAGNPHVSVAFIRDFPVNDTLCLDVTTLSARDSIGWDSLKYWFHIPQLPKLFADKIAQGDDQIFLRVVSKDNLSYSIDTTNLTNNNVLAISYLNHNVSIFYTNTIQEQYAVLESKYD